MVKWFDGFLVSLFLCVSVLQLVYAEDHINANIALLVPVTSKGLDSNVEVEETYLFTNLLTSLQNTITDKDYQDFHISLYLAVDSGDLIYDQKGASKILKKLFAKYIPRVSLKLIRLDGHSQRITAIWNELVRRAYISGTNNSGGRASSRNDYFLFLSDDAIVQSSGFIRNIVTQLNSNNNFGVVAFTEKHKYSETGSWPTFPCFHRTHVDIFGSDGAFDRVFMNSYVDIWISDVYRAFGAGSAVIEPKAQILNMVGGQDSPRYNPTFPGWDAYIAAVERGRRRVAMYLGTLAPTCVEDIIPALRDRFLWQGESQSPSQSPSPSQSQVLRQQEEVNGIVFVDVSGEDADSLATTATTAAAMGDNRETQQAVYRFHWRPQDLSYGREGYHYVDYCRQAPGCVL